MEYMLRPSFRWYCISGSLHMEMVCPPEDVTHPSTNRPDVQIETNVLPLNRNCQTTRTITVKHNKNPKINRKSKIKQNLT